MSIINANGRQIKSRELQEIDFKDFISHIAEPKCPVCSGKGWSEWSEIEQSLIPCSCVMINAYIERMKLAETEGRIDKQIEIIKG